MHIDRISIHFVKAEIAVINDAATIDDLLRRANISPELLTCDDGHVTPHQFCCLSQAMCVLLGDEIVGRGLGKLPLGYFSTLCKYAIHGDTLMKCLARAAKFSNLFEQVSGIRLDLVTEGDVTRYVATSLYGREHDFFLIERNFLNIYKYLCWVAGRHLQLRRADLTISPPRYMEDYRQLFYCDLHFNQPQNQLVFNTTELLHTPAHHEKDLPAMLEGAPQSFWLRPSLMRSYAGMVRRVLFDSTEGDALDFETVAAKLEISTVTLRRRLKKENISFQEIKDHIRRDRAIALMHDSSKTISDIAFELGYSDPSAFYRAFRQWVGATPNQYRATVRR